MIKRRLGFAGILLAGLILVLYLTGGEKIFGRLGASRCEKLWEESEEVIVEGEVYQKTRKEEKLILYLKKIQIREMGNGKAVADERLLVYLDEKGNGPEIGQRILVKGSVGFFDPAANPGNFDQKNYYKQQNIQAVLWKGKVLEKQVKKTSFREKLWQFRNRTADEICRRMGKRRGGILCAVLLGDSFYTEEKVKELYRVAGIGHLLAISGLHISFFGTGLYRGLRKSGFSILQAGVAGSLLLGSYVVMTGMSVSALRAFTMFLIRMGAELTGREYDGMTALGIAESGLLLANPLRLFTAGFQLSFAAVLGIYLIDPGKKKGRFSDSVRISVELWFFLLPATLWHYYETCLYAPAWNLLVIPMASVLLLCGSAGVAVMLIPCGAGDIMQSVLWKITEWILLFYEKGSGLLLELPGARWIPGRPWLWQIACYYGIFLFYLWRKRKEKKVGRQIGKQVVRQLVTAGILLILLGIPKWKRGQMELTMLDVGQGDCFFFRDGNGKNYLIDGGSSSVDAAGKYRLEPFLKFRGVKKLDYVWVTHGDVDHLNAVEELLERKKYGVEIQYLIFPEQKYWDEKLIELCNLAEEAGTKVRVMEMDTIFQSGKLKMRCLWPGEGEPSENGNENSLVLHLQYGKITMLFTGDLENTGEELVAERIKNLRKKGELPACYDLLKVGHHGSRNATGEELLEVIRPRAAFCSSGKENRYGHPHAETLERLAKWGVSLYNTKDRGAVSMYTDGRKYGIQSP